MIVLPSVGIVTESFISTLQAQPVHQCRILERNNTVSTHLIAKSEYIAPIAGLFIPAVSELVA